MPIVLRRQQVKSSRQKYVAIRVRLGCGSDGQVTLFGLFLSALAALLMPFLDNSRVLVKTHKLRIGRSIRPTATN